MLQERVPIAGDIYRHFKGNVYEVIVAKAMNTDTEEDMIVYKTFSGDNYYVRKLSEFLSEVDKEKYPDIDKQWRFEFLINRKDNSFNDVFIIDNNLVPVIEADGYKIIFYGISDQEEIDTLIPEVIEELKYYKDMIYKYISVCKLQNNLYIINYADKLGTSFIKHKPSKLVSYKILNKTGKELLPGAKRE